MSALRTAQGASRAAAIMEDAVAKASRIVASFRTYARSEEDEPPCDIPLAQETRGVLELFRGKEGSAPIAAVEIAEDSSVFARREDLDRILFTILKNAVQAAGGSGRVSVSSREEGGTVYLSVSDDGPGIPDEIKGRVFEPFFSTKPMGEGAGLGLEMALRLARRNGGGIAFESRPGETVFTVALPLRGDPGARGAHGS